MKIFRCSALWIFMALHAVAHEWDTIIYSSQIGAKRLDSSPSEKFLLSGKPLNKGDVFEYDLEKIIESATSESKKVAGFSGEARVLTMQMQAYPSPHSKQWFFVVALIDEAENIVRVIVNSNGDSWPVGKMHDAFEAQESENLKSDQPSIATIRTIGYGPGGIVMNSLLVEAEPAVEVLKKLFGAMEEVSIDGMIPRLILVGDTSKPSKKISCDLKNLSLEAAVDALCSAAGFRYENFGSYFVVRVDGLDENWVRVVQHLQGAESILGVDLMKGGEEEVAGAIRESLIKLLGKVKGADDAKSFRLVFSRRDSTLIFEGNRPYVDQVKAALVLSMAKVKLENLKFEEE